MSADYPRVKMRLTDKKTLRMRLPLKNARWHGAYKNVDEAVQAARKAGVSEPFYIDYVTKED